jgi:hypothetical protein
MESAAARPRPNTERKTSRWRRFCKAMNPISSISRIVAQSVILSVAVSTQAQGIFQNLNFEAATPGPPITGPIIGADYQPVGLALPGWNASIGGVPVTLVLQNDFTGGAASIDIFGPNWTSIGPGIIGGNYTVFLQAFNPGLGNVSLWQDGTVPATAESLQFKAWEFLPTAVFSVSFDGNALSPAAISSGVSPSGQAYTLYGANLSPYAGQTGQLEFTALAGNGPSWIEFDDIAFSTQVVPEPCPLVLTGVGALAFALYRRFAPKRK